MIKLTEVLDLKNKIKRFNTFYRECPIIKCKMHTPVRLKLQKEKTEGMENTYIAKEIVDKAGMQTWCQTKQNNAEPGNSPLTRELIVEYVEDTEGAALMQELYQGLENALESSTSEEIQCWIDSGGKVNEDLLSGETLLSRAAARGCVEVVQALLAAGASVTQLQGGEEAQKGKSALFIAADEGEIEVVKALLAAGASVNQLQGEGEEKGRSALYIAAVDGHIEVVQALLAAGALVNQLQGEGTEKGISALYIAAARGHIEVVKALLAAGASVNQLQGEGWYKGISALFIAADEGEIEVVKALLAAGASVNQLQGEEEHEGMSALYIAAARGHIEVVKALLAAGASVNQLQGGEGWYKGKSALYIAAARGHVEVVQALLAAGAFPTDSIIAQAKEDTEIQSAISEARIIFDLTKDWIEQKISKLDFFQQCTLPLEPSPRVVKQYYKSLMLHQAVLLNAFKKSQGMMIEQRKKLIEDLSALNANQTSAIEECLKNNMLTCDLSPGAGARRSILTAAVQLTSNLGNSSSNNRAEQDSEAPNIERPTKRLKSAYSGSL